MQTEIRILFLLLCLVSFVYGEDIQELIEKAKKNNPQIKKIEKELKIQKKKAKVSKKLFNPSVSLSFGGEDAFKEPAKAITLKASQKIPYLKKLDIIQKIEEKGYEEKYYYLLSKKNEIIQEIYQSAFKLWFLREKIKIYEEYIKLTEQIKKQFENKFSYGDRLKFYIMLENFYKEKQTALLDEKIELSNLEKLINDNIKDVKIDLQIKKTSLDTDELILQLKEKSPLLLSYKKKLEKLSESYKLSKMIYYPDLSLSIKTSPEDNLEDSFSISMGVNLPIWKTIRQEKIVLETKLKKVSIEEEIRYVENLLKFQILSSYYKIKKSEYIYNIINSSLKEKYKMNIKVSTEEFERGIRDISDLILAIKDSLNADLEVATAIYTSNIEYIRIKSIIGEL
ncbi:TolC family protein [Persephonella sp.]